jgi:APA family basic amino acid/polyamine antiporter
MTERSQIGTLSAAALVVANMVGAGVFMTSGFAIADLHTPERVLLAWLCGGVLALAGAISYGAMARHIPESGGEYTFLAKLVHPFAGFIAGWVSLLGGFTAPIAAAALTLQAYLGPLVDPGLGGEWIGVGAIVLACVAHLRLRRGIHLQNIAVAIKVSLMVAFAVVGGWIVHRQPPTSSELAAAVPPFDVTSFAMTLIWISFAYSGWNAAVYVGGLVRDPRTALPRALVMGTACAAIVYIAVNAVFLYAAPVDAIAGRPDVAAVAAVAIGGHMLGVGVSLLVALALFTSISSMVMTGPRVYARMAEDGLFPAWLGVGGAVPARAVLFQGAAAIAIVWNADLVGVLGYVGFLLGLSAAATVASLIYVRYRRGADAVPIPGYPWLQVGYIAATLAISALMAAGDPRAVAIALGSVALGAPIYLWMVTRRPALHINSLPSGHASRRPLRTLRDASLLRRGLLSVSGEKAVQKQEPNRSP